MKPKRAFCNVTTGKMAFPQVNHHLLIKGGGGGGGIEPLHEVLPNINPNKIVQNPIFDGYTFCMVLSNGHSYDHKKELRHKITSRGGTISYLITKKCHFVILEDAKLQKDSNQTRTANKYGIPIVPVHFLDDCIAVGRVIDWNKYAADHDDDDDDEADGGGHFDENFTKGVITVTGSTTKRATSTMQKQLKEWPFLDPNGPQFHCNPYQLVKFTFLINKEYGIRKGEIPFCVLEIHVSNNEDSDPKFCIYVNSGSLNVQKVDKTNRQREGTTTTTMTNKASINNCRYCNDATRALDTYSKLHKMYTSPPHSMVKWSTNDTDVDIPSDIGSPQYQKVIQSWLVAQKTPDENVAELVNHLWTEAVGELDNALSVKVAAISLEKIEKADGLLNEIHRRLDSGQSDNNDRHLEDEFYDHVPQKKKEPLTNKAALVRQHELVQLMRDIVSTSEAIGTDESKDSILARYSALDCFVTHLSHDSEEFDKVRKMVITSQRDTDIQIKNIFSLRRPLEEATFRHYLSNRMFLFHASSFRNFVGILSRGLLLPKIVVSDGSQGPGNLGYGIYFANSSSTSIKYAKPSGTKRTRLMLVAQVALGNCFETRTKIVNSKQLPEGFQSIRGVRNTESDPSDFEDDEYVIFRSNQQQLKYLVEFSLPGDDVGSLPLVPNLRKPKAVVRPTVDKITIEDIRNVSFEASQALDVQFGLQSKDNLPVFLRSVHVRAKLIDLAAKVVVLQEYINKSVVPIEAKYVFPLDEMGAVCGFEAFINGKHVVGVIEEKPQAHQKYKKAIEEGHGAYLMDQEMPDVFVVLVGNLPAEAEVLIKITYVTELATEGELIDFSLPGSLAPWQKSLAPLEQAMENIVTVDNSQTKETSLEISIEMPFEIRSLLSTTHGIIFKKTETKATVKLIESEDLDRPFQLLISLAEIHVPRMWVEQHPDEGTEACMLTFYPTFESEQPEFGTVIFLIDCSNSMRSGSFINAQAITLLCLHHLHVNWSFNIVAFGSTYEELFPVPCQKSLESVKLAEEFVLGLAANMGNTRLSSPLRQHFLLPPSGGHIQSVFLISDGHVTDFGQLLLEQATKHYRVCRIFTLGVESNSVPCNRYFMKSLALRGAGAFELFDDRVKAKWEVKVKSQLKKAAQAVLTDVTVEWQQLDESDAKKPIQAPKHTVTLFHGTRHVVYGFVPNCTVATLNAKVNGKVLSTVVSTSELSKTHGKLLHTLTAKAVIRDWEDGILHVDRMHHEGLKASMKQSIIAMSKNYSILTSITSFVAIEKRDSSSEEGAPNRPTVMDVLSKENVDQLPYIAYEDDDFTTEIVGYSCSAPKHTPSIRSGLKSKSFQKQPTEFVNFHAPVTAEGTLNKIDEILPASGETVNYGIEQHSKSFCLKNYKDDESERPVADAVFKSVDVSTAPRSITQTAQTFGFGSSYVQQREVGLFGGQKSSPVASASAPLSAVTPTVQTFGFTPTTDQKLQELIQRSDDTSRAAVAFGGSASSSVLTAPTTVRFGSSNPQPSSGFLLGAPVAFKSSPLPSAWATPRTVTPTVQSFGFGSPKRSTNATSLFGAPTSGFGAPTSGFGAPTSGFGAPTSGFGAPTSLFGASSSLKAIETSLQDDHGPPRPIVQSTASGIPHISRSYGIPEAFPPLTGGGFRIATPTPPSEPSKLFGNVSVPFAATTNLVAAKRSFEYSCQKPVPPPPHYKFQEEIEQISPTADSQIESEQDDDDDEPQMEENVTTDNIQLRKKCIKKKKLSFWESEDKSPVINTAIDESILSVAQFESTKTNYIGGLPLISFILTIIESKVPENVKKLIQTGTSSYKTRNWMKTQTEIIMETYTKKCHRNLDDDVTSTPQVHLKLTVNEILSSLVNTDGFIDSRALNSLLKTEKLAEKLQFAGIKSLGDAAASEITNMCITLALILCIINTFLNDSRRQNTNADDLRAAVKMLIVCVPPLNFGRFLCALLYVTYVDQRHPMVYNTLQLKNNWESFILQFIEMNHQ